MVDTVRVGMLTGFFSKPCGAGARRAEQHDVHNIYLLSQQYFLLA